MLQFRQGDLFFEQVAEIPQNLPVVTHVLAVGEVSGHAHVIDNESEAQVYEANTPENSLVSHYIKVEKATQINHSILKTGEWSKEHEPITLPPGKYKVVRQREYNPFSNDVRRIED
jgi:hypothetical protein